MSITIRKALPQDARHLVEFNAAMARETEGKELCLATLTDGVRRVLEDPTKGLYLVAEVDGVVAGGLLITFEWSDWRNGSFWWIQSVYTRPEYRRRGVYTRLHDEVVRMAEASGESCGIRLYVDRDNERARATYERLGMRAARYDFYEADLPRPDAN